MQTSINVSDTISTDTPSTIDSLDQGALEELPGADLDDRLRIIPGFQLFRRSSSIVANPTTQGVSLRGIGSTGASRTLVLWDGIPQNDPFGGWVYWSRFDPDELQRVEVMEAASTSVFGDRAMGGSISLFSLPTHTDSYLQYEGGTDATQELSTGMAESWRHWAAAMNVHMFTTDGYYIVPASVRGSVDEPAGVDYVGGNARLDYFTASERLFLRLDMLAEHRNNGTELTHNSTGLGTVAGNYAKILHSDEFSVLAWYTQDAYRSTYSSVSADRDSERLIETQTVPATGGGGSAFWSHTEERWRTLLGLDLERDEGWSTDRFATGPRVSGGHQFERGGFGQGQLNLGSLHLYAGLRGDIVRSGESFVSPSGGFAWGRHSLRLHGSVFRGFRAPTLNELYRQFRVGNTLTLANATLVPEKLFGSEVGVDFVHGKTHAGLTLFRNSLADLITNVTLSETPSTITRQRENASAALARGIEAAVGHTWHNLQGQLSYLYADSNYSTHLRIAEVPRNQGSAMLAYQQRNTFFSVSLRSYSAQFDDDLNQFRLPGFATFQAALRQRLSKNLSSIAEIDNILNHQYYVAFTPTPNIGSPRLWRIGLRWDQK